MGIPNARPIAWNYGPVDDRPRYRPTPAVAGPRPSPPPWTRDSPSSNSSRGGYYGYCAGPTVSFTPGPTPSPTSIRSYSFGSGPCPTSSPSPNVEGPPYQRTFAFPSVRGRSEDY